MRWPTPFRTSKRSSWCDGKKDHKDNPEYMNKKFDFFAAAFKAWLSPNGTFVLPNTRQKREPRRTSRGA
jgi:hypothetical protein